MTPKLRPATIEDVPALQQLIHKSVESLGGAYYSAGQIASALRHVFGVDTQLIVDGTYFIAEVDREIVGSGGWSRRRTLFGGDQMKTSGSQSMLSGSDALLDPAS